jgi:hypothetical protein
MLLKKDGLFFPGDRHDMLNAGVFMIPKKRRSEFHLTQFLEATCNYNDYMMFAEQSAISLWCHLNNIPIHKKWIYNFQVNFYNLNFKALKPQDIHIIHFSWCKPDSDHFTALQEKFHHFFYMHSVLAMCSQNKYDHFNIQEG